MCVRVRTSASARPPMRRFVVCTQFGSMQCDEKKKILDVRCDIFFFQSLNVFESHTNTCTRMCEIASTIVDQIHLVLFTYEI